jgi:hypothetical protein
VVFPAIDAKNAGGSNFSPFSLLKIMDILLHLLRSLQLIDAANVLFYITCGCRLHTGCNFFGALP